MRHLIACLLLCLASHFALEAAFGADANAPRTGSAYLYGDPIDREVRMPKAYGSRVIVRGHFAEDDVRADFRNGNWYLRRLRPGAH